MPNEALTGIIEAAVADANADATPDLVPEDTGDVEVVAPEGETAVEGEETVVPEGEEALEKEELAVEGEAPVVKDEKAPVKEKSEVEKILEAAGIKAPLPGQKENKIPYSRTVKIIGNALKKATDAHAAALTTVETRATAAEARAKNFETADHIATTNPDEYMRRLAIVNPAYRKFVDAAAGKGDGKTPVIDTAAAEAAAAKLGPKPGPDVKFEDGSLGYSPDQMQKREDWLVAKAKSEAVAETTAAVTEAFEKRFGPIEEKWKSDQMTTASLGRIRQDIKEAQETWGDLYPKDGTPEQLAVSKLLKENRGMPLSVALTKVLVPVARASKQKVREEVLAEQRKRPAAARSVGVAQTKVVADPNVVRGTEDVIREAIAAAGLK